MECYVILLKLDWLGGDFYFGVRFFYKKKKKDVYMVVSVCFIIFFKVFLGIVY